MARVQRREGAIAAALTPVDGPRLLVEALRALRIDGAQRPFADALELFIAGQLPEVPPFLFGQRWWDGVLLAGYRLTDDADLAAHGVIWSVADQKKHPFEVQLRVDREVAVCVRLCFGCRDPERPRRTPPDWLFELSESAEGTATQNTHEDEGR